MNKLRDVWVDILFLLFLLLLSINAIQSDFSLFHNINLIFHEAGHTIFYFGDFISILGGSLMQLLVSIIVTIAFLREGRFYGICFGLWWIGENLVDISVYAGDAKLRALPLLGGDGVIHDWWYILSSVGLLDKATTVGLVFKTAGVIIMGLTLTWILYNINHKLEAAQKSKI